MSAEDRHPYVSGRMTVPPSHAEAVTPDDVAELSYVTLGVSVATAGDIAAVTLSGAEIIFTVAAGVMFPARLKQIKETGTTATGIVAWD